MAEKGISTRLMTTAPSSAAYAKTASLLQPCWNQMRTWNHIIWERLEMASCRWARDCFELIHSHLETIHPLSTCMRKWCFLSVFIFPILSHTHTPNRHTVHTVPHCTGERQHFPLTSVSPECDFQPRSAVISRGPKEEESVEKFK